MTVKKIEPAVKTRKKVISPETVKKKVLIVEIENLSHELEYAEFRLPQAIKEFLALNPTRREKQQIQDELEAYNIT